MAGKSLTKRLADLQQKKADLDAQIKQIEREQSQQLRKEKHERARIIGMAMLRLVETGEWSEDKLMDLISPWIISGKERRFLGLESLAKLTKKTKTAENKSKAKALPEPSKPPATKAAKVSPLPEPVSNIESEFNL